MQKLSDHFLITQVLSLQEIGFWTILSSKYKSDEIIDDIVIIKTFSLEPYELFHILKRLEDYEIIIREKIGKEQYALKLSRSLFKH